MKLKKIFLTAAALIASLLMHAQDAAAPAAAEEAESAAPTAAQSALAASMEDRSYMADFAASKAAINMIDDITKKVRPLVFVKTDIVNGAKHYVFTYTDGTAGELLVPMNTAFKFEVPHPRYYRNAMEAMLRGDNDSAIMNLRAYIYPYVKMLELPESPSLSIHSDVDKFIDALIATKRLKEAAALSAEIPYQTAGVTIDSAGIKLARAFIENKMFSEAYAIMDKIPLAAEHPDVLAAFMELVGDLRKSGKTKESLLWYTKISNMDTPQKKYALIWMVYGDILLGNTVSAEVYLGQIGELETSDQYFSLVRMVKGIFREAQGKTSEALDLFAEGIVYGNAQSDWYPELLFRAGMCYKKMEQAISAPELKKNEGFVAANEIFAQIWTLYPDNQYAKKAKAELVELPKAKEEPKEEAQ